MSRRAIFVGGPLDGHVDDDHHPTPSGTIAAPEYLDANGPTSRGFLDRHGEIREDVMVRQVVYRGHTITDLDGRRLTIYALEDELVGGSSPRPNVSLWALAVERRELRHRTAYAEREAEASDDLARRALRQADALAGALRDLRDNETARKAREDGEWTEPSGVT